MAGKHPTKQLLGLAVLAAMVAALSAHASHINWGTAGQQLYAADGETPLPGHRERSETTTGFVQLLWLGPNGVYDGLSATGDGAQGDDQVIAKSWIGDGSPVFIADTPGQFDAGDNPPSAPYTSGADSFAIRVFDTAVSAADWAAGNIPAAGNCNHVVFANPVKVADFYNLWIETGLLVPKADQTIDFPALSAKTYGDAPFAASATASSGLTVTFASDNTAVATVAQACGDWTVVPVGAGEATITATQDGDGNWNPALPAGRTLTVLPAPLTAIAEDKARVFGGANPAPTIRYEGLRYADTAPATPPAASCTADAASPPGEYDIVLTGGVDPNYTLTLQNGTLTVVEGVAMRLWAAADGDAVPTALEFGEAETAAAGEDMLDESAQPGHAACLSCPFPSATEPRLLTRDFRPLPAGDLTRWRLEVGTATSDHRSLTTAPSFTLTWDVGVPAAGREVWLQALADDRPVGFPVDMNARNELPGVAPGTVFEIIYGVPQQDTIELRQGWNAVGTPLLSPTSLGDLATAGRGAAKIAFPAWRWTVNGFEPADADAPFLAETGYLVRCVAESATLTVTGLPPDGVFPLSTGWHLLSPVAAMAPPTAGRSGGQAAWRWDVGSQSYHPTDQFAPGDACWWYGGGETTTGGEPTAGEVLKSTRGRDLEPDAGDLGTLVAGNTAFAIDLYHQWRSEDGNLFLSPHSISIALGMTYAGARGDTAAQMAAALRFGLPDDRLHAAFNALDLELAARGEDAAGMDGEPFRLRVVNQLWGERTYSFLAPFLDTLAEHYGAGLRAMDFIGAAESARLVINDWVAYQTEQRIQNLLPQGSVSNLTRLVLTNAVYFNAAWEAPFAPENTAPAPFTRLDGSQIQIPMMRQQTNFRAFVGAGCRAVELPYDGNELSMLILLPEAGTFADFERTLAAAALQTVLDGLTVYNVDLAMPKFEYACKASLKVMLSQLGMPAAFADGADFSGIDGTRNLLVSDVFHQAFVKVNEAGTEAAAATGVVVGVTSMPEPLTLTIDRPFLFLIRDHATGAVLFLGRVVEP